MAQAHYAGQGQGNGTRSAREYDDPGFPADRRHRHPVSNIAELRLVIVHRCPRPGSGRHCCRHVGHRDRHHGEDGAVRNMNGPSTRVEDFKLEDWLPSWLPPDTAIASLAGLTVLAVFLTVLLALRSYNPFERRYAEIIQRKETLRRAAIDTRRQRPQMIAAGLMQTAVQGLNLMRSHHAGEARFLPAQTGMRSRDATIR